MTAGAWLLSGIVASSFVTGVIIFFLDEKRHTLRTWLNLLGASVKLVLVGILLDGIYHRCVFEARWPVAPGFELALGADANSVLFVTLSSVLWLLTTIYAVGYLEQAPRRSRFFGFFSMCVSATTGVALAANLVTFLTFYELLTVSTYPLVVHRCTPAAMRAGKVYLAYTLSGGAVLLLAVAWLQHVVGPAEFHAGGDVGPWVASHRGTLQAIFALFAVGLGVKTALVPLHGWLPRAMIAPAPVSALLHAVAVVKAGAFGLVRVVYDVYGLDSAARLGLLQPLMIVAAVTIVYGSLKALAQDELKKRLAYSTVSQVSYIVLGLSLAGPIAAVGGLVHLVHQGIMKITLFFGAGNYAETLGIHRVSEMDGVGRRLPWTTAAFTVAALGMIGVPPLAGYVSKYYLQKGAAAAGYGMIGWVLTASSLLNAAYFLPILYRSWFKKPPRAWPDAHRVGRWEAHPLLLVPAVITAAFVLYAGVMASSPLSPLGWVRLVAARELAPSGFPVDPGIVGTPGGVLDKLWATIWPIVLGGALGAAVTRLGLDRENAGRGSRTHG